MRMITDLAARAVFAAALLFVTYTVIEPALR